MNKPIFFIALTIITLLSMLIGKQLSKSKTTVDEYFLSGRNLKVLPLMLTFLATQLGGGAILGGAQAAYQHGIYAIYYSLGIALGFFILAFGLGKKFRSLGVATIPEIFGKIYNSKCLQRASAIILIITTFFILVALGVATKQFFLALGIDNSLWFIGFWAAIIFYTTAGGFGAVVKTDILQVIFILITFSIIALFCFLPSNNNTVATIFNNISAQNTSSLPWASWLLMPMLFTVIGQDMGQRCFAAKSPKIVSFATAGAGALLVLASLIPVILGILALSKGANITDASILIDIVEQLTNPAVASLFACSILLAILSTADSLICAISSNLSYDLFNSLKILNSENTKSLVAKVSTAIIGVSAIVYSLWFTNILELMVTAYSLAVASLFIPVVFGAIAKNKNIIALKCSFAVGFLSFILFSIFLISEYKAIFCIALAAVAYFTLSFCCKTTGCKT